MARRLIPDVLYGKLGVALAGLFILAVVALLVFG